MALPGFVYPSRLHAAALLRSLVLPNRPFPAILLQASQFDYRPRSDCPLPFHQDPYFFYLSGATDIHDAFLITTLAPDLPLDPLQPAALEPAHVLSILFLPPIIPQDVIWSGPPPSLSQIHRSLPDLSDVKYLSDLPDYLKQLSSSRSILSLPWLQHPLAHPSTELLDAFNEARSIKSPQEINIIAHANQISSDAHQAVMRALNTPQILSEFDAESIFLSHCRSRRAVHQAYQPIFAYGAHASILHYTKNDAVIPSSFSGVLLVDAGCEVLGYASDITRTLPIGNGGKFSPQARAIYSIVLEMQNAALERIKAGVEWQDIQTLMHKVAAKGLLDLGILCNATVEQCYEHGHVIPFFPHGVGHFLGLDTHDVAGLPNGKGQHPTLKYLRLQRKLKAGNVVTVEPGLYFNPFLLDPVKESEFINQKVLADYMKVGGIRLEDNVVVTETGIKNLTCVVKDIEEVERLCSPSTTSTSTLNA